MRGLRRSLALVAAISLGAFGVMTLAATPANAVDGSDRSLPPVGGGSSSTKSRAIEIMSKSYGEFLRIKQSREAPFDWSTDGCSWTPWPWSAEQNGPCQQHDFGYRNFGKGLTLERTEDRRGWIDGRFLDEMNRNCREHWWYASCPGGPYTMYAAVRNFNDWRG